jgi:hypothetical protein
MRGGTGSPGFSFAPARRRSREAQGALEPAADGVDVGDGGCSAGWLRRHDVEGRLRASQAVRAGREGRKPPVESEGPSADGRGTGRAHDDDERGAKRSGCVSAGTASAHQETSEPATPTNLRRRRHPLRCPQIADFARERSGGAEAVPSRAESLVRSSCEEFQASETGSAVPQKADRL